MSGSCQAVVTELSVWSCDMVDGPCGFELRLLESVIAGIHGNCSSAAFFTWLLYVSEDYIICNFVNGNRQASVQGVQNDVKSFLKEHTLPVQVLRWSKKGCFSFSVPGLRVIHRNLKQETNFNSREGFFRKSPFCTFSWINPGFGGPCGMLWIFFLIAIFQGAQ